MRHVAQSGRDSTAPRVLRTLTTVVVSVTVAEKKAPMVRMRRTRVWNDSTFPKIHNPLTRTSNYNLVSVLPASTGHDGDALAFQEEGSATCTEGYEAKSRVTASTVLPCSASTLTKNKKLGAPRSHKLDCWRDFLRGLRYGPESEPVPILERLRVLARTTA